MKSFKEVVLEGVAVTSDFKMSGYTTASGKPSTRKVRAHRTTMGSKADDGLDKKDMSKDVLGAIKKFVGRQYDEEVELDEVSTDGYHKAAVKSRMDAAVKVMSSMGSDKQAKTKLDARNKGLKRLSDRTSTEMKKANSGPQKPSASTHDGDDRGYGKGRYMGDSFEQEGEMVEAQSAAVRWQKALANAKKKREEEDQRKKENVKRALTPTNKD